MLLVKAVVHTMNMGTYLDRKPMETTKDGQHIVIHDGGNDGK